MSTSGSCAPQGRSGVRLVILYVIQYSTVYCIHNGYSLSKKLFIIINNISNKQQRQVVKGIPLTTTKLYLQTIGGLNHQSFIRSFIQYKIYLNRNKKRMSEFTVEEQSVDWEEWDGRSPFWIHCVAGSAAGVVEHVAVYPLDTVRTHIQVCASCLKPTSTGGSKQLTALRGLRSNNVRTNHPLPTGMWQTIRYLMNEPPTLTIATESATTTASAGGIVRLWRGVHTILIGCVPAHALYFSSYEIVKASTLDSNGQVTTYGSSLAGAAAVLAHDLVLTPLDTLKQRMQLGHYSSTASAIKLITQSEGIVALYRSFPVTLATNLPYGIIMVTTHEACKQTLEPQTQVHNWQHVLAASSIAGFTAAAITTPLDRIKTALQTQSLTPTTCAQPEHCRALRYESWMHAATTIAREEGIAGFTRGLLPRVLAHTPAVAISWTTYESLKQFLMKNYT